MSLEQELANVEPDRIEVLDVSKSFTTKRGTLAALENISLRVSEGEFVCLVGTERVRQIDAAQHHRGSGEAGSPAGSWPAAAPIVEPGRDRMMMFQEHALFPWLDVMGNVLFGLNLKPGLNSQERLEVASYYLKLVGLERFTHSNIHELSGGMKQRVALARALAPNPRVLLMDEPFGALDALTREQLYGDIQRIWEARRKTIIFVTHNVREAACLGDRVYPLLPKSRAHPPRVRDHPCRGPRDINSVELAQYSSEITAALKGFTEGEEVAE